MLAVTAASTDFTWRDGDRVLRFGRGAIDDAGELLGDDYVLLTTPRTEKLAPAVVSGARAVHHVAPGLVDELAADLLDDVHGDLIVALGGGRVVDTAKAIAAARGGGAPPGGLPPTPSAAAKTNAHPPPAGRVAPTPRRP